MPPFPKRVAAGALSALALACTACGGEDATGLAEQPAAAAAADRPFISLTEAETALERGRLELVRTGRGEAAADGVEPRPLESARYESVSGRELDVLVFPTEEAARRAWPDAVDAADPGDGGSAVRAFNVVAVFPGSLAEVDTYRAVARALRAIATGCSGGRAADAPLRRLCDPAGGADIPPAGTGVDRDEAARIGATIEVGGLGYSAEIARRLNPRIEPDEELVRGRLPPPGRGWFGVFVRVCNRTDEPLRAAALDRLALVAAFGERVEPVRVSRGNPFAYAGRRVGPGDCLPPPNSAAERVAGGALVLFAVSDELLAERPVALEVTGPDGERERVVLDV